jgi:hypothetical protein
MSKKQSRAIVPLKSLFLLVLIIPMYFTVTGEISDSQPQPVQLETKKMGWRRRKIRHIAAMHNVV